MSLPSEITNEYVQAESDKLDGAFDMDAIDDAMTPYFEELVERIAAAHNLTEEQAEDLGDRLCWKLELLPVNPGL